MPTPLQDTLLYFAYGSNMSLPRLGARVASLRKLGVARLAGHRLCFHKVGRDGSAKCDVSASDDPQDRVLGVLFEIAAAERAALDRCEGLGQGYQIKTVTVTLAGGHQADAFTYYATRIDAGLRPFRWYKAHVLHGALEHGLPEDYVQAIRLVSAMDDPDPARHQRETALYL
jgi:gamma-glutamylcyclotransferase